MIAYLGREKSRIPAWCDRVLRKGTNLRQFEYTAAPLRFSDHRPVYATFECTISTVNEAVKDSLSREIYERRRLDVGDRTANADSKDSDDEEITGYDSIAPGLPPASSDRRKWWLDNGEIFWDPTSFNFFTNLAEVFLSARMLSLRQPSLSQTPSALQILSA